MGQYHKPVNVTKKQYIHPHKFGDGLKLLEFGLSSMGTMSALAVLLSNSNNRGGGDLHSEKPIIGSWAGDNIAIIGDYAEKDDTTGVTWDDLEDYEDISAQVFEAMLDDEYVKQHFEDLAKKADYLFESNPEMLAVLKNHAKEQ